MYAWQTLALSRVEFKSLEFQKSTKGVKEATRDLLYMIGLPHFPDPDVTRIDDMIYLNWEVAGRYLQFTVEFPGRVSYVRHDVGEDVTTDFGYIDVEGGTKPVWDLVDWLLFGPSSNRGECG